MSQAKKKRTAGNKKNKENIEEKQEDTCPVCNTEVNDEPDTKVIECDICKSWSHKEGAIGFPVCGNHGLRRQLPNKLVLQGMQQGGKTNYVTQPHFKQTP